ncbi:Cation/H(+) antiporter 15 [Linum grandiflorum]
MDINAEPNTYRTPAHPGVPCLIANITASHGLWQSENPLSQALPILAMQLATLIVVTRIIHSLLTPYHIPQIVADILGGIVVGPTALGRIRYFQYMFPLKSITLVEQVAYWALTCHVFLLGLETDVASVLRAGKKAVHVAAGGVLFPLAIGSGLYYLVEAITVANDVSGKGNSRRSGHFPYFAAPLGMTGFPVVSKILADLKLIHTDLGRLAMSCSLVEDLVGWIFVLILFPYTVSFLNVIYSVPATVVFILFCVYAVRPLLEFLIRQTSRYSCMSNEYYLSFVLISVSMFACSTEVLGTGSLIGAFVFGVIMPDRALAGLMIDKFDDMISRYLLPMYFVCCGLRTQLMEVVDYWGLTLFILLLSCLLKVFGALITTSRYNISRRDAFALGMLSNSKGILAAFTASLALDKQILVSHEYSMLVLCIVIMTGIGAPVVAYMYQPSKRLSHYKRRTLQQAKSDSELRVLACFHGPYNLTGMINLFDSSATAERSNSTLNLFALHLVELRGRSSAMLIVHNRGKRYRDWTESEPIVTALETFSSLNDSVTVQILTALSPFGTMPDDICSLAEDKRVTFMILPFHKPPGRVPGNSSFRGVNLNVMDNAPCTVGLFVDRGYGDRLNEENALWKREVAMLFFGGPDDREALAYALRMALSGVVNLHVVRFESATDDSIRINERLHDDDDNHEFEGRNVLDASTYINREKKLDQKQLDELRKRSAAQKSAIHYEVRKVSGEDEVISTLKEMTRTLAIDLFVVGKGEAALQPMTAAMLDWCEYPELGAVGDALATMSGSRSSVLVIQRYIGPMEDGDGGGRSEHSVVDVGDENQDSVHSSTSSGSRTKREPIGKWQLLGEEDLRKHKRDNWFD